MKSEIEKLRLPFTKMLACVWFFWAASVTSAWGEESPTGLCLFVAGTVLVAIGMLGRIWCLAVISGRKNKILVSDGPYALCRNPLYFFSLVATIGVGLGTGTIFIPFAAGMAFAVYYPLVIKSEERRLRSRFGAAFDEYVRSVPAFIPNLRNAASAPSNWNVGVKEFQSGLADSGWIFVAFAALHLSAELHHAGYLPSWWQLP